LQYRLSTNLLVKIESAHATMHVSYDGMCLNGPLKLISQILTVGANGPFSKEDFVESLSASTDRNSAELVFMNLLSAGGIESADNPAGSLTPGAYSWDELGWGVARVFHESVAFSEFVQGDPEGFREIEKFGAGVSKNGFGPNVVKEFDKELSRFQLLTPQDLNANFFNVLKNRRTARSFDTDKLISSEELSSILHYSGRAQRVTKNEFFGDQLRKATPSGGARHPVEIYPQLLSPCGDVPAGSFYYDCVKHELIRLGDTSEELIKTIGQNQPGSSGMPLAFIVSCRFSRNLWKYRYAKSYLFSLFDVGHLVSTIILTLEALGMGAFLTPALNVKVSSKHLGLDNIFDECPAYLVTAGFKKQA